MTSDGERLATARRLLDKLGVRPEDLLADHHTAARAVPTWAEYLPQVIAAAGPGASRTRPTGGTVSHRIWCSWGG